VLEGPDEGVATDADPMYFEDGVIGVVGRVSPERRLDGGQYVESDASRSTTHSVPPEDCVTANADSAVRMLFLEVCLGDDGDINVVLRVIKLFRFGNS